MSWSDVDNLKESVGQTFLCYICFCSWKAESWLGDGGVHVAKHGLVCAACTKKLDAINSKRQGRAF